MKKEKFDQCVWFLKSEMELHPDYNFSLLLSQIRSYERVSGFSKEEKTKLFQVYKEWQTNYTLEQHQEHGQNYLQNQVRYQRGHYLHIMFETISKFLNNETINGGFQIDFKTALEKALDGELDQS